MPVATDAHLDLDGRLMHVQGVARWVIGPSMQDRYLYAACPSPPCIGGSVALLQYR